MCIRRAVLAVALVAAAVPLSRSHAEGPIVHEVWDGRPRAEDEAPITFTKPDDPPCPIETVASTTTTPVSSSIPSTALSETPATTANELDALASGEREVLLSTALLILLCTVILCLFASHVARLWNLDWAQTPLIATILGALVGGLVKYTLRGGDVMMDRILAFNEDVFFIALLPPIVFDRYEN